MSNDEISYLFKVEVYNPLGEKITFYHYDNLQTKAFLSKNDSLRSSIDRRKREIIQFKDGRVMHKFYRDGHSHIFSSIDDYNSLACDDISNDFFKTHKQKQNGEYDYIYFYTLKPNQIDNFSKHKVRHLEDFQGGYDAHQVMVLNTGAVLEINQKGNMANWYPNVETFELCYRIFNKNEVW